jgi:hypothetical protein
MDMRDFTIKPEEEISRYAPPASYELRGKQFTVIFEGGEKAALMFPEENGPHCMKIKDSIWLIVTQPPEPPAVYVLDLENGLVTRAVPAADGGLDLSFGALEGKSAQLHSLTGDLLGNTVEWVLGVSEASVICVSFEDNAAVLTRPFAPDAPKLSVAGFRAVRITDTVFLQVASVTYGEKAASVCLLSDYHRVLSVGCILRPEKAARMIGGHGRYLSEAYPDVVGGVDLRTISPFNNSSIFQYTPPRCFELVGKTMELVMDDGYDFTLRFMDNDKLEWTRAGDPPAVADYVCLKADDTTYLVNYELSDVRPRVNHSFVIDLENMLVTRIIASIGRNPRWPYLMTTEYEFGMIADGREFKSYPRPGFTSDLIGNIVQWAYGSEMATVHIYHCADFYRLTHARDRVVSKKDAQENYAFTEFQNALPSTDEPTVYIKIKEGMYLISLTEINGEKLLGAKMGFRSNTLCFLQNYKSCYDIGRGFGTTTRPDGTDSETNIMIGAYGRLIGAADDELKKMLTDPNPYLV